MGKRKHERVFPRLTMALARKDVEMNELANAIGISCSTLLNKMTGRTDFTLREALALKEYIAYNGTVEALFAKKESGGAE